MSSDQKQRDQALDPSQSFIVQAPAGSGKTELLTQRFLCLLSYVQEPEEILAITFTKKAASEMRSRIRDALQRAERETLPETAHEQKTWRLAKQALAQDKARHWGLLANPNRLRVKTIDAFNTLLTRQLPLLSHFGAPPEIVDHPKALYREAVQSFLAHLEEKLEWSAAIAQLLLHLDNNMKQAEDLLVDMLSKRDQWLPDIMAHQNHPSLRRFLEANLSAVIRDGLNELRASFPETCVSDLLDLLHYAAGNLKASNPASPILACSELKVLPGVSPEDKAAWLGISELLLTKDETWRKRIDVKLGFPAATKAKTPENQRAKEYKTRIEELIEHLSHNDKLLSSLIEVNYLPEATYTDSQWEIIEALHEVLKIVVAQLTVIFKQFGRIDYTENAQAALLALGTEEAPTDLALVLDYQIKHLLVDEFQDTSNNQFSLLEKLVNGWQPGDGRSLFLVGDPMQSIYRFREADVGLFIRARKQGIGPVPLVPLTLSVNFRSTASVVHWINHHFDKVMPAFDDIGSGAVSYTPSSPKPSLEDSLETLGAAVKLHAFVDSPPQALGTALVELIQEAKNIDSEGSIAILVRSRSHLQYLIPALRKAGLPYQAVEIDPLEAKPLIQDLLALTRALLYPADRLAWLAILRSPCCGLKLDDLLLLAGTDRYKPLWQGLDKSENFSTLSPDGQERLRRILPVLQSSLKERQREELHLWIEKTWLLLGGPAAAENEAELKDAKIFFGLLKKLVQSGTGFNGGLRWEALEESIQKLYAQSSSAGSIQIMTIHNAKGLEFDTVILPHLEKGTGTNDKDLMTWMQRPLMNKSQALILAPIHAVDENPDLTYQHIARQDNNKTRHENGRLLYVAATRAKKTLHLMLSLKTNSKGELSQPPDGSMLKKLWPSIQDKLAYQARPLNSTTTIQEPQPFKRLVSEWKNPLSLSMNTERPAHNKVQGFHLLQNEAQALGTVVHRLLQEIAEWGITWWQSKVTKQQDSYIHRLLIDKGILPRATAACLPKVRLAIENTLADSRGRWILEQKEAKAELALTALFAKGPKMLVIDRTFVDENGIRWIVDYKTSVPNNEDLISFLVREKEKYAEQLQQYSQAMQMFDTRPLRLGLYFPMIPTWCELL